MIDFTKREKKCIIAGAGSQTQIPLDIYEEDYVIGADGGYDFLKSQGIPIDLVIGDFDSALHVPDHPNLIRLPKEKDDTDMLEAIKKGLEMGYRDFYIFGGTGGRLDHTIANIQCLAYLLDHEAHGCLFGREIIITAISNEEIIFDKENKGMISVFSYHEKAEGVTLKGLKYPLNRAVLTNHVPIGVSNEFTGREGRVLVEDGMLLLIYNRMQRGKGFKFS